jgi:hypothetical protein
MDAVDAGLLFLTALNAIVWWTVWQRRPSRPQQRGGVWLRDQLWQHLAGLHQAVWARVGRLHQWAQCRPLRERGDTRPVPPCVLCGDARHTMQDHVRWPQAELAYRAHTPAEATAPNGATRATGLPDS